MVHALMAFFTNIAHSCLCRAAAEHLLQKLDRQHFKGVCFFASESKQWVILEGSGRCKSKHSSPVSERLG